MQKNNIFRKIKIKIKVIIFKQKVIFQNKLYK